jgi:hypothetical protein
MFYEAIFQPSGEMEYNADAKNLEGKTIAVQEGWIIEDGPFKGQNCFYIPSSTVGWIPKSDLKTNTNRCESNFPPGHISLISQCDCIEAARHF